MRAPPACLPLVLLLTACGLKPGADRPEPPFDPTGLYELQLTMAAGRTSMRMEIGRNPGGELRARLLGEQDALLRLQEARVGVHGREVLIYSKNAVDEVRFALNFDTPNRFGGIMEMNRLTGPLNPRAATVHGIRVPNERPHAFPKER